jgi:hypothetical protein
VPDSSFSPHRPQLSGRSSVCAMTLAPFVASPELVAFPHASSVAT